MLVKTTKIFSKNLFSNMKLLLQHREENIKCFLRGRIKSNQFLAIFPKYSKGT